MDFRTSQGQRTISHCRQGHQDQETVVPENRDIEKHSCYMPFISGLRGKDDRYNEDEFTVEERKEMI